MGIRVRIRVRLGDGVSVTLLLDGDVHTLLLVGGIVLGQDAQQGTQAQPPLLLRDALTGRGVGYAKSLKGIHSPLCGDHRVKLTRSSSLQ